MAKKTQSNSSLPRGFRAVGVHCGIKAKGVLDLALLVSDVPAAAAGVFTRSTVVGAPVTVSRERVRAGRARGVVVNSGVSNVAMGTRGVAAARSMAASAAAAVGCLEKEMLVASTGVIGEPLPLAKIQAALPAAIRGLSPRGLPSAARAIMTTDTVPKLAHARLRIGSREVRVAGIAKGSGMVEPNMATMLSFLVTDAAVAPALLRRILRASADRSFNRLTIDGESSTSDTVLLFANGCAENARLAKSSDRGASRFAQAIGDVCETLAKDLARDGEGATTLISVRIEGAKSPADASLAARRVANSLLVKTAIFGRDPNWGRILQTIGAAGVAIRLDRAEVRLSGVRVFGSGASTGPAARRKAALRLARPEVEIAVRLGAGRSGASCWTCDLSYDYVRINAEYTT